MPPRSRGNQARRILALFCFLGGILLFIIGLGLLGAGWMLRGESLPDGLAWQAPLELVNNRDLNLATSLLPLKDVASGDALNAALEGGHWENAYALIAFDSTLADSTRIGVLLQLGSRYAAGGRQAQAARCYLSAARIATLSPLLSDAVRLDTFLQVGAGLRSVGAVDAARLATDQAFLLGRSSPSLRREPQSRRLTQIANAYAALGADSLANQARTLAAEPLALSTAEMSSLPREPFVLTAGKMPASAERAGAQQRRVAAAKQLQEDIEQGNIARPSDLPSDSVKQLADALIEEDAAQVVFVKQQSAMEKEPAVKLAILRDYVAWLGLKYRVARGAFGASLVPEWEKQAEAIGAAWDAAWVDLFDFYENQANSIPNAQAVSQAMEDVTRQKLLAVRWGWYHASVDDLHSYLSELSAQLREASILTLRVDSLSMNGKTTDVLVPDELVGKNEQALPR